jgi:ribosome biogenesis GTPase
VTSLNGIVLKAQSGFFTVRTDAGQIVVCQLRGRLKRRRQSSDLAAIGDQVTLSMQPDGQGMIESVAPRRSVLARRAPTGYGRGSQRAAARERAQVIIANPDQVVFVFACAEPAPRLGALDRFLVMAEAAGLPALICANKVDLVSPEQAQALFGAYPPLGYPVLYTSAKHAAGVTDLRERLRGRLSVLAGPSGVGKSSLLNAVQPGLGLRAQAVSLATQKGRHTTVYPELLPLEAGGFVADTPGLRALALWDIEPEELDGYFVEMRPLVAGCAFSNCTHLTEPGCAIRSAVAAGQIALSRYQSYCRMRLGESNVEPTSE